MNLYEIDSNVLECIDMETGEIIDTEKLDELMLQRDAKIENICCWIKNLKAQAEAIKTEKDNLAYRQKVAENKIESLKSYLASYLNGRPFETAKCKISFRASEKLVILDGAKVPEEYLKLKIDYDKTALKKAVKDGLEFDGVVLESNNNIQIK